MHLLVFIWVEVRQLCRCHHQHWRCQLPPQQHASGRRRCMEATLVPLAGSGICSVSTAHCCRVLAPLELVPLPGSLQRKTTRRTLNPDQGCGPAAVAGDVLAAVPGVHRAGASYRQPAAVPGLRVQPQRPAEHQPRHRRHARRRVSSQLSSGFRWWFLVFRHQPWHRRHARHHVSLQFDIRVCVQEQCSILRRGCCTLHVPTARRWHMDRAYPCCIAWRSVPAHLSTAARLQLLSLTTCLRNRALLRHELHCLAAVPSWMAAA